MNEMNAVRLLSPGDLRSVKEPVPSPKAGETLVRVTSVSLCGSDLHWFSEGGIGDTRITSPVLLGHEAAGIIESGPQKGLRVAVDPALPCHRCEFCLEGNPNLCPQTRFAGDGKTDGMLREFIAWPDHCLFPLPDEISSDEGALLEALGVALHTVDLGHLRPGMTVGVFGSGPIGLMIVQLARAAGATKIIATDVIEHRVNRAAENGATHVLRAEDGRERAEIAALTGKRGVDVAFEAAGDDEAIETAVTAAKPGGTVVLAGIPPVDRTSFTASTARRKGLTIKLVRRMKFVYPRAIALAAQQIVKLKPLITDKYPLDQAGAAFTKAVTRTGLKIVINP